MKPSLVALAALLIPVSAGAASPAAETPINGPLWRADGGGVLPSAGATPTTGMCWRVSMSLRLAADGPAAPTPTLRGAPAHCVVPSVYIGYLRDTLFLEGLDARGGRLFVATGMNPLHQTAEAPPVSAAGGAIQSADRAAPRVDTLISVPIGAPIARVRWYDVDANQQPRLLGETVWGNVRPAAP
jgi:hypothetical protein